MKKPLLQQPLLFPPPERPPLSAWQGIHYLEIFPQNPELEEAEQFLGLRPRPRLHYLPSKPRPVLGEEWLDLEAWWRLVLLLQGRLTPLPPKSGPVEP